MRSRIGVLALAVAACAPAQTTEPTPVDPSYVAVANEVCPLMWRWQLQVGAVMNDMSAATRIEEDPAVRRTYYADAIESARDLNMRLRRSLQDLSPGPYVDLLTEDIRNGLAQAEAIIDELEMQASVTNGAYTEFVPVFFIGFEKVIDVAKPEMATYADDDLIAAFVSVPQCQSGVKDASDGIPRYIPLENA